MTKSEIAHTKLIQAKSILQCAAAAVDAKRSQFEPDEPSWAMEVAIDLMGDVIASIKTNNTDLWLPILRAKALANAALVAHRDTDADGHAIEVARVLDAAADDLDRACNWLQQRTPRKQPDPKPEEPPLRLVPISGGAQS